MMEEKMMEGEMGNNKTFLGNFWVKAVLFLMLFIAGVLTVIACLGSILLLGNRSYEFNEREFVETSLSRYMVGEAYEVMEWYQQYKGDKTRQDRAMDRMFAGSGESCKVYKDEQLVYRYPDKARADYEFSYELPYHYSTYTAEYTVKILVDNTSPNPVRKPYRAAFLMMGFLYRHSYEIFGMAAAGLLACLLFFVLLMCAAGHRNGRSGIVPGVLHRIHFDVLTLILFFIAVGEFAVLDNIHYYRSLDFPLLFVLFGVIDVPLGIWYCMEGAIRIKRRELVKSTLIGTVWHWCVKLCKKCWQLLVMLVKSIPLVPVTVIAFGVITIFEFLGIITVRYSEDLAVIWVIEKIVLFAAVVYLAVCIKKLMKQARNLAQGDLDSKVDTKYMIPQFRENGEDLNNISEGLQRAVEDRMRSERFKTELITNVSHDLKTPLTSIINYAELLSDERLEQAKVPEYAEVLYRQSQRLKKLLDDLMEASKASTGNVEVNLERVEVGVILTQAQGEYQQRLMDKQLNLIMKQPEDPVYIRADGRHLWRVFDNLLSNIVKYSQEDSRVYITIQPVDDAVRIIFRNMSKYALDLDASELSERFVRGDKSRHMEGSGLGLSIAMSLVELQGGHMDITTDGDLFKVTLEFDREYRY